jgi:BlaI family transcriptional regulator, penicillinase repressor
VPRAGGSVPCKNGLDTAGLSVLLLQHTAAFTALDMRNDKHRNLSRRERQIMDILYQRHRATASEIHQALPDAPSYSAVRAKLRVLEEKGHVRHEEESLRYVYLPTMGRETARRSALRHVVSTFFEGSVEQAVAALLDLDAARLRAEDLDRIQDIIDQAKKESER